MAAVETSMNGDIKFTIGHEDGHEYPTQDAPLHEEVIFKVLHKFRGPPSSGNRDIGLFWFCLLPNVEVREIATITEIR